MSGSFSRDDFSAFITDSFTHSNTLEVLTTDQETAVCYLGKNLLYVKVFVKMTNALEKVRCLLLLNTQLLAASFNKTKQNKKKKKHLSSMARASS